MLRWTLKRYGIPKSATLALLNPLSSSPPILSTVLTSLAEHGTDVEVARLSLGWITKLDCTDMDTREIAQGAGLNAVLSAFKIHRGEMELREQCCRVIANVCMLAADDFDASVVAAADGGNAGECKNNNFADALVEYQAVELVLGVMTQPSALSMRGLQRASTALMNLLTFSHGGVPNAVQHDGDNVLSSFLYHLVDQSTDPATSAETRLGLQAAADATLTSILRMVTHQAPDNAQSISYRFQLINFSTLDAVVRAAAAFGGADESIEHTPLMCHAPILHKAWEILSLASSHPPNHGLVFDALRPFALRAMIASTIRCCSSDSPHSLRFQVGQDVTPDGALVAKVHVAFVSTLTDLTSTRKDLKSDAVETSAVDESVSRTLPTEAAVAVVDEISSGVVSEWSMEILVRATRVVQQRLARLNTDHEARDSLDVAQKHMALLTNLCESDPAVASSNMLSILEPILDVYTSLTRMRIRSSSSSSVIAAAHSPLVPLIGQAFSCIWNVANSPQGREALKTSPVRTYIQTIVVAAQEEIEQAKSAAAANVDAAAAGEHTKSSTQADAVVTSLHSIGTKLLDKLDAAVYNPEYTHSKNMRQSN